MHDALSMHLFVKCRLGSFDFVPKHSQDTEAIDGSMIF